MSVALLGRATGLPGLMPESCGDRGHKARIKSPSTATDQWLRYQAIRNSMTPEQKAEHDEQIRLSLLWTRIEIGGSLGWMPLGDAVRECSGTYSMIVMDLLREHLGSCVATWEVGKSRADVCRMLGRLLDENEKKR